MATIYHGTDVNYGQMSRGIDWATYAANRDFVWFEAAAGNGIQLGYGTPLYTEGFFLANRPLARAQAGLRIGYYFFGDTHASAVDSANYFISLLGSLNPGEIIALDIENAFHAMPNDGWAYDFCTTIKNYYGFKPAVYMSQLNGVALDWPLTSGAANLWMANYTLSSTDFSQTVGVASWNGALPGYPSGYEWLQYTSAGSAPGIIGNVDLDTFYSPNNTLADWDALGYGGSAPPPPPASPGLLTFASVSDPVIVYTEPAPQTINLPAESYDKVLFSKKFNTSVTSSSWPVSIAGPPTGLSQYAYPIGNYTYTANGLPFNDTDYGFINAGDYGQFPGTLPAVVVQPIVDSNGGLTFDVTVNGISGSVTVALSLNIALIAYPNTTTVPLSSVSQPVAQSSVFAGGSPNDYATYRRIASDTSTGTGATTVAHGQNTIPNLLYWVQDNSGTIEMQPVAWASDGHTTAFGMSMDSTNIYTYVDAGNNTKAWLRWYKDN